MDLVDILRYSYLGAALAVLLAAVIPPLRSRFVVYGARASSAPSSAEKEKAAAARKETDGASTNIISTLLDEIATWTVPHDWFWIFYFVSASASAFWPGEILWLRGALYTAVAERTAVRSSSMNFEQVKITWVLMLIQGGRRLYECLTLNDFAEFQDDTKPSSQMWVGHWILGLLFYAATSVAIWIEGIPALDTHTLSFRDLTFSAPTLRTIISVLIFILASGFQHDCHAYLAYLKATKPDGTKNTDKSEDEYKLPAHPAFQPLIAPHYTAECFIYISLALVAAPQGRWINGTLACAFVFVVVNLGVTAGITREWYVQRFGPEAVRGKWRLLPPIY